MTWLGHSPPANKRASVLGHLSIAFGLIGSKTWGSAMYQRSYQIFFLMGLIAGGKSTRENYCASVAHVCNVQCSILNTECLFIFILPHPCPTLLLASLEIYCTCTLNHPNRTSSHTLQKKTLNRFITCELQYCVTKISFRF